MLERGLETMREGGHVVSVLDPFDQSFYRKYGWEMFARLQRLEIEPAMIRVPDDDTIAHEAVDLRRPAGASLAFYNDFARRHHTLVQRGESEWEQRLRIFSRSSDSAARGVVRVSRDGSVVGLIGYDLSSKADDWHPTFTATLFIYKDEASKRAMLRYLKALSHQVKTIRFDLPVDADLWPYLSDRPCKRETRDQFMIRIVSIGALNGLAIDADDLTVDVEIADPQAPWNAGVWRFTVDDGVLCVERHERAQLRCGIGALSSVLAGFTDFSEMIAVGAIEALPSYEGQDLPRTTPFLADYF
jgi:predicted acetyltransferase